MRFPIGILCMCMIAPPSSAGDPSVANYQAAVQAYETKDYAKCATLLTVIVESTPWPSEVSQYQAAECLALAGRKQDAVQMLKGAVEHPAFRDNWGIADDPALTSLHDDPAWPLLLQAARQKAKLGPAMLAGVDLRYKRNHPPRYPAEGPRNGGPYEVNLIVLVAPDGSPYQVTVERSSGVEVLDEAAIDAAKHWRYFAATSEGRKFVSAVRIPITFIP